MAVIHEWRCLAHSAFEGPEGICPHGCTTVIREFRTAPGTRSARTKGTDRNLERLAARHGLTDMSNRNGSVGGTRAARAAANNPFAATWGEIPKGNVYEVGKGEVARDGASGGATAALAGLRMNEALPAGMQADLAAAPSFLDIAKTLPRVRPQLPGKEYQYGTSAQLDALIKAK